MGQQMYAQNQEYDQNSEPINIIPMKDPFSGRDTAEKDAPALRKIRES